MSEEEYKLQQEYLTPKSDRQQKLLNQARYTDEVILGLVNGNISDIVHELIAHNRELTNALYEDLKYYKERKAF